MPRIVPYIPISKISIAKIMTKKKVKPLIKYQTIRKVIPIPKESKPLIL